MFKSAIARFFWLGLLVAILGNIEISSGLQLKSRPAEEWIKRLERSERISNLKIEEVLARLEIRAGDAVADIGAGSGVFSRPFAQAVGPAGKVYSVEVDQGFLDHIAQWASEEGFHNIEPVLGEFDDPRLPTRKVDLAFFHDVLHHVEHRALYLKNLAGYVNPTGRIAVIDMRKGHPDVPHRDDPTLQISREELRRWMADAGFRQIEEFDNLFDRKFFIVFARQ